MKIIVLILNVILCFVVNGLFFSQSVISELYEIEEESYDEPKPKKPKKDPFDKYKKK